MSTDSKIIILDSWPEDGHTPSQFYVYDALGRFVFLKARDRAKAQQLADEHFGHKHYVVKKVQKAIVR